MYIMIASLACEVTVVLAQRSTEDTNFAEDTSFCLIIAVTSQGS